MYSSATVWYSDSVMSAGVLVTGGVSGVFGALSSGVMPVRTELFEKRRRVVIGIESWGARRRRIGVAEMLGRVVRPTRVVCTLRQAMRASLEAFERAMVGELDGCPVKGWVDWDKMTRREARRIPPRDSRN
jgi:hypothetical protein